MSQIPQRMFRSGILLAVMTALLVYTQALAHQANAHTHQHAEARYLGNEGILVQDGNTKVLFDPFFHNDFGIYQSVPEAIRQAMFDGVAPYDGIDALVISHAHDDHFDADDLTRYLHTHSGVHLIAPQQAVAQLGEAVVTRYGSRITSVALEFGQSPAQFHIGSLFIDVVRIPHAGWPARREVQNLVYRVQLSPATTVMHLGDADIGVEHYLPYRGHWRARRTQHAFPPYWFYLRLEGRDVLDTYLNVERHTGVHVPVELPAPLSQGLYDVFHQPGETRRIGAPTNP